MKQSQRKGKHRTGPSPAQAADLQSWRDGAREFRAGRVWEAHHAWEQGWRALAQPWRDRVQGAICVAGALWLLERSRTGGALRLVRLARRLLERSKPGPSGGPRFPAALGALGKAIAALETDRPREARRALSGLKCRVERPRRTRPLSADLSKRESNDEREVGADREASNPRRHA